MLIYIYLFVFLSKSFHIYLSIYLFDFLKWSFWLFIVCILAQSTVQFKITRTHTHTHAHTHMYINMYIYICVCVCVSVCVFELYQEIFACFIFSFPGHYQVLEQDFCFEVCHMWLHWLASFQHFWYRGRSCSSDSNFSNES